MIHAIEHRKIQLFDDYNRQGIGKRRSSKRSSKRRPPQKFNFNGFPVKIKIPTKSKPKIIKGRVTKLPPITDFRKSMNTGVMKPPQAVKSISIPLPKKKIGIDTLIKKTAVSSKEQQTIPTQNSKQQTDTLKKAQESDSSVGKIIKIFTGLAIVGAMSFGIYKYIQYRKKHNIKLKK